MILFILFLLSFQRPRLTDDMKLIEVLNEIQKLRSEVEELRSVIKKNFYPNDISSNVKQFPQPAPKSQALK